MADLKYNLQFEKLCEILKLGELSNEPKMIDGGLMHKSTLLKLKKANMQLKLLIHLSWLDLKQ